MTAAPKTTGTDYRRVEPEPSDRKQTMAPTSMDVHIGGRIKLRRFQIGMSQERFAAEIGVARQQVDKWERGENRLTGGRIYDISLTLNVHPGWFFDDFAGGVPQADAAAGMKDLMTPEMVQLASSFRMLTLDQRRNIKAIMEAFGVSNVGTGADDAEG